MVINHSYAMLMATRLELLYGMAFETRTCMPAETLPNLLLKKAMQLIKAPLQHTESGILSPSPTTSKYYLDPSKTVVP